jgi:DNA-binding LacI/PurR family transcriptional regulator
MGNVRRPDWGDQVLPDAYQIGELAAKYLMQRGHRHLVFFNLEAGHWSLRVYGHAFASTAQDAGARVERLEQASVSSTEYWHDYSVDAVDNLVRKFLALEPRPTGIFVADDMQVAMLQPALQKHGVQLGAGADGERVEIISCNNEQPYLVGLQPRPAVVDIRVESIGRRGVEQLLWRLDHPEVTERIITAIEPVVITPEDASRAMAERAAG